MNDCNVIPESLRVNLNNVIKHFLKFLKCSYKIFTRDQSYQGKQNFYAHPVSLLSIKINVMLRMSLGTNILEEI